MKLGLRLESLGLPLRRALDEASRLGAVGVQVDAVGDLAPEQLTQTGRRELRNRLRSLNLELAALGCPLRRGLDTAENLQPRIEHVRNVMSLSYDLGPRRVIVEMPAIPVEQPEAPASPAVSPGGLILGTAPHAADPAKLLRESLTDLAAHGDRTGTVLTLEAGLDPADKLAAYMATFATGALSVAYDPANFLVNGHDPITSLAPLHGRIAHVLARDARRSAVSRSAAETALGAGDIDWMTFVAMLDTMDYRDWIVIKRDAGAGLEFLRRFVKPVN